jgi:uncharacterized protein
LCASSGLRLSPRFYDSDHLVYLDIASPGTRANLASNPAVEINVVDHILRRGFRFKGVARFLSEGAEYQRAIELLGAHGSLVQRAHGVVLIRVTHASALMSPAYAIGRSAAELAAEFSEYYGELAAERVSSSRG